MRHHRVMKKFGRSTAHRKMLMKGLVTNLILAESIKTTLPKAKEARKDADKIVTIAKKGLAEVKLGTRKGDGAEMCILQYVCAAEVAAPAAAEEASKEVK